MNVLGALEDVRKDWQFVWDWRYGLHNFQDPSQDSDNWWLRMLAPLGKIPHGPLREQMYRAFADLLQQRPNTAKECRKVLQNMLATLATIRRCLHFTLREGHPMTSAVSAAHMTTISTEKHLSMSLSAFASSGNCLEIERETFTHYAWHQGHFVSLLARPNIVGRVAEQHGAPIGHYVCERRGDIAALLTFGVRRSYRGIGVAEALLCDTLRFVSSNSFTGRHQSLHFELDKAHNCVIPTIP